MKSQIQDEKPYKKQSVQSALSLSILLTDAGIII